MGHPLATTLNSAGVDVVATDIETNAVSAFAEAGGSVAQPSEIDVASADVVLTMLPEGGHVRAVHEVVLAELTPGTILLDCSTIDLTTTRELAAAAREHGCELVDAPVSGGPEGAAEGTLSFMVGGQEQAIEKIRPLLDIMGQSVTTFGEAGMGQAAKACHNMIVGITGLAVFEGFALAESLGLDAADFHGLCSTAAAACWTLENRCPVPGVVDTAPASNNYRPGFAARLMAKDLQLAQDAAAVAGVETLFGHQAAERFAAFVADGSGDLDYSAYFKTLRPETPNS
jgi:3-hydroxyisobutyrate dehydrogenase